MSTFKSFSSALYPSIFAIFLIALLFVALYVLGGVNSKKAEKFTNQSTMQTATLLPENQVFVFQGTQMPDEPSAAIKFDQGDPSMNTVDGTQGSSKSMFMFTYNQCKPECCDYSPYSCSGGCVCMTPKQIDFIGTRGSNNKYDKCSPDDSTY